MVVGGSAYLLAAPRTNGGSKKRIPNFFNQTIELYLNWARPVLVKSSGQNNSLWISSRTGRRFTYKNLGTLISKVTFRTLGVDVSPHLFRTAYSPTNLVNFGIGHGAVIAGGGYTYFNPQTGHEFSAVTGFTYT
jgi:site-specific recombinase XerD